MPVLNPDGTQARVPSQTPAKTTSAVTTPQVASSAVDFQPGFAAQLNTINQPLSASGDNSIVLPNTPIQRGFIVQDKNFANSSIVGFRFQYNPSTISASQSVQSTGAALSYMLATPQDGTNVLAPTNTTVTFTVMADRTYELWNSPYQAALQGAGIGGFGSDPALVGCYTDIYQLQKLTGMVQPVQNAIINQNADVTAAFTTGTATPALLASGTSTGIMQMIPCWTFISPATGTLTYYGFIVEWDYTVTHWTQFMVPMRCAIDITLQLLPVPSTVTAGINNPLNQAVLINPGLVGFGSLPGI